VVTIKEGKLETALLPLDNYPYKVPSNWFWVRIGEVTEVVTGSTPPKKETRFFNGNIPFAKPNDLDQGRWLEDTHEHLTEEGLKISRPIPPNSTLVCCIGSIGKVAFNNNMCSTNQQINSLIPYKCLDPLFVYYYCNTQEFKNSLIRDSSATTISIINKSKMCKIRITIPPLPEQKRIVSRIESLLGKINEAKQLIAEAKETSADRCAAILAKAFRGELTKKWREENPDVEPVNKLLERAQQEVSSVKTRRGVPKNVAENEVVHNVQLPNTWKWLSVSELLYSGILIDVKDGNHGSNHPKTSEFTSSGLPFITASQVKDFKIDYEGAYKISGEPLHKLKIGFAEPGDVILTHKGTVGRVAINKEKCVLSPQTTYYRVNGMLLNNRYLTYYLFSPLYFNQVAQVMSQTTRNFVPISEQYNQFIPIAPVEEQCHISDILDTLFDLSTQSYINVDLESQIESLIQTVLAKAFRGELGTNNPNEESALELL